MYQQISSDGTLLMFGGNSGFTTYWGLINTSNLTFSKKYYTGANYEYSHSYENNFSKQEYLPKDIAGSIFYEPGNNAREKEMRDYLKRLWGDKYNY